MNARQEQITVPLTLHVLILQDHILVLVMMDILEMDVQVRISLTLHVLIRSVGSFTCTHNDGYRGDGLSSTCEYDICICCCCP